MKTHAYMKGKHLCLPLCSVAVPKKPHTIIFYVKYNRSLSNGLMENFRSENEYMIEYEYKFGISNQSRSLSRCSSLLLITRGGGLRKQIVVLRVDLESPYRFKKLFLYSIGHLH